MCLCPIPGRYYVCLCVCVCARYNVGIPELSYSMYGDRHNWCYICHAGTWLLLTVSQLPALLAFGGIRRCSTSDIVRFVC